MRKVEGMLRNAIGRPEVVKAARAWRIMHRWSEVVGEGLAERSTPDRYDRGTVWVAVRGSAWAQELRLMKETILAKMNGMAGDTLFTEIRFGVRPPKPAPIPMPEPQAPGAKTKDARKKPENARMPHDGAIVPGESGGGSVAPSNETPEATPEETSNAPTEGATGTVSAGESPDWREGLSILEIARRRMAERGGSPPDED